MKSFDIKTKIFFGDQALDRLAEIPYKRVLIVTDPFVAKGSMIDLVTEPLKRGTKNLRFLKMLCRILRLKKSVRASGKCWNTNPTQLLR